MATAAHDLRSAGRRGILLGDRLTTAYGDHDGQHQERPEGQGERDPHLVGVQLTEVQEGHPAYGATVGDQPPSRSAPTSACRTSTCPTTEAMSFSTLPPTSGIFTVTSACTVCAVTPPRSARRSVPST